MDKRKAIVIAVVLFLLIGLGTFVFANPSEERLDGNDTGITDNGNNNEVDGENTNGEEETEEGLCSAEDRVYAVFIEEATSKVKLLQLKNRGEGGISSFTLPDGWGTEGIHVYCFAVSKNGKMASDSVYQTVE